MNVGEAIAGRRSVRAFTDRPVDPAMLREVLERAQCAPSGGNLQPWHAIALGGEALRRLVDHVGQFVDDGPKGYQPEYRIYPADLPDPYEARRFGVGEAMYAALGIAREDKPGRRAQFAANFRAFGAPVLMLVHSPRFMGPPQWADMGMWLQTVMLLLRERGLDSCAQEAWAMYQHRIREVVSLPDDHVLFCGLSIGWKDASAAINTFQVPRAALGENIRFEGI